MNTNQPLIKVNNLSVNFTQGGRIFNAVKRVSFDIKEKEIVALVGESGSGKSVTAHSVLKLLPYPAASHPSGEIYFEGANLLTMTEDEIRKVRGNQIGMIFQEPISALNPLHTIEKQIGEILFIHKGLTGKDARKRTLELLDLVKIPQPETRLGSYPHELSGGQRQRVMIAMALANEPKLLIADEPTTALDVTVQARILELLDELRQTMGMAILLITHDLGIVKKFADRVMVMNQGELVEQNNTTLIFSEPKHPYTKHLIASEPKGQPALIPTDKEQHTILKTDQLKVWFPIKRGVFRRTVDYTRALNPINIELKQGRTLGVVGESGSGKTTMGLAILRLIASEGEIHFDGKDLKNLQKNQTKAFRQSMQIVFQDPFSSLSPRMPISEIIAEGLKVHYQFTQEEIDKKVVQVLQEVGLDPETRFRFPHEFSGGQRQRVAIARALIMNPKLIILDEPTSALDRSVQAQVVDLLRTLQEKHGFSYIFISHDLKVVKCLSHDLIVLKDGNVMEHGPAEQVFSSPQQEYTKQLLNAAYDLQ